MIRTLIDSAPNPCLYRAKWVLPVSSPPIEDGAVIIRGLTIEQVGSFHDCKKQLPSQAWVDLGEVILLPGLINCHTHLDNSAFAGKTPRGAGDFIGWIEALSSVKAEIPEAVILSERSKAWKILPDTGTIAVGDIASRLVDGEDLNGAPIWSSIFYEVVGFNRERASVSYTKSKKYFEQSARSFSGVWSRFVLSPHGPHSLHEEFLVKLSDRCNLRNDIISLHVAESEEEVELLQTGAGPFRKSLQSRGYWDDNYQAPGCTPVEYLKELGMLNKNLLATHCVHLSPEDVGLIAENGVTVCVCPRSNSYIGVGQPRIQKFIESGLRLCLGSDGLASVDSLSIFDEMAYIKLHYPSIGAERILRMATLGGAEGLRMEALLGSLEMNKIARFLAYESGSVSDPLEMITGGIDHQKLHWVGGEIDLRP